MLTSSISLIKQSPLIDYKPAAASSVLNKLIVVIALAALSCLAAYYLVRHVFKSSAQPLPQMAPDASPPTRNARFSRREILETYRTNPQSCTESQKFVIFQAVQSIESLVNLMKEISGSSTIDLQHPLCSQVVVDYFKAGNKEAHVRLAEWLKLEKTFHVSLLGKSLEALMARRQAGQPVNLYAMQHLMKTYRSQSWHVSQDAQQKALLPIYHSTVACAMGVLIQEEPNNHHTQELANWMMTQLEYDLQIFVQWAAIFKAKESEKGAGRNMHYPLLNDMMAVFKQRWGHNHPEVVNLDASMKTYLRSKAP